MTNEKLISLFEMYLCHLEQSDIVPEEMPEELKHLRAGHVSASVHLRHVAYMCEMAIRFVKEGRIEKAMRWLGFVQSSLYHNGLYAIDDLREHSRPAMELNIPESADWSREQHDRDNQRRVRSDLDQP